MLAVSATTKEEGDKAVTEVASNTHSEHRFPAPSSEEECRKPVLDA